LDTSQTSAESIAIDVKRLSDVGLH
jgi:hypothetical protein